MDEEIEHMQWQLDKRTHDDQDRQRRAKGRAHGSKVTSNGTNSKAAKANQHVFHDRTHSNRHQQGSPNRKHQASAAAGDAVDTVAVKAAARSASSATTQTLDPSVWSLQQTTEEEAAVVASLCPAAAVSQYYQQQQVHEHHLEPTEQQQQEAAYYHLRLQHTTDLAKARDRMCKHIQQDGGCYVSADAADSGALTHLLLMLQHKQHHSDALSTLVMQPVDCEAHHSKAAQSPGSAAAAAAGVASSSTVVHIGHQGYQHRGVCGTNAAVKLWVTAMPLAAVLILQAEPHAAADRAAHAGHNISSAVSSGSSMSPSSVSLFDGSLSFSMESSSDESAAGLSPNGTVLVLSSGSNSSSSASKQHSRGKDTAEAALLAAASSSSSSAAALLCESASNSAMKHIRVGKHADAAVVVAAVVKAVAAGLVISLHVKGHATAHTVAYGALQAAASSLVSAESSSRSFGVLLVPGAAHEHVHAVTHGYTAAESVAGTGHKADHSSRAAGDASMAVGGFSAAFYGIGGGGRAAGDHGGLQHRHAQEVWLCVVPFGQA